MLAGAVDRLGWERDAMRVLDIAAGNGISGEALAAAGLHPVLGTDIVESARVAALRDRPRLYDQYLTLDLMALSETEQAAVASLHANALSCVAPVGETPGRELPSDALLAAARLLAPDALVVYMHDPNLGVPDAMTPGRWTGGLGADTQVEELERRRYVHRRTVNGAPLEMDGVVWRLRRAQAQ
jgi:hypothetical protein